MAYFEGTVTMPKNTMYVVGKHLNLEMKEQRTNFLDRTAEGEEINKVEEGDGLSGRAIPPSNVYFGSVKTDYRSTSIAQRGDPGMSGRQKSVNVTGMLREDHVVLGDDVTDYSKRY